MMDDDDGWQPDGSYKITWIPGYSFLGHERQEQDTIETSYRRVEPQNDMRVISDLTKDRE